MCECRPNVNAAMVLANRATGRSKAIAVPDHTGGNPDAVANQKHETWTPVKTRTSGLSALLNNQESDSDEPVAQPVVPRRLMSKARVPLGSYVPAFSGEGCYDQDADFAMCWCYSSAYSISTRSRQDHTKKNQLVINAADDVGRLDKRLADGTKCWQMGCPICQRLVCRLDKMLAEGTSNLSTFRLQTGRNVGRWDVQSADIPFADWTKY